MTRVFGLFFCSMMMVLATGCNLVSQLAGDIASGLGVDLSGVDVEELLSQFMSQM